MSQDARAAVERIFRDEYGRLIASLVRRFGDIDLAEDAAGEALVTALEKWPAHGVPPNPGAWLTTTAGNRAIDRLRREKLRDGKHQAAVMIEDDTPHEPTGVIEDDRLRLIFTCCHPALAPEARIALTLRLLGGLTVAEIASAFLVQETTMAQWITRAKGKIKGANIPYRVPEAADLPGRVGAVLAVLLPENVTLAGVTCAGGTVQSQSVSSAVCIVSNLPVGGTAVVDLTLLGGLPGASSARMSLSGDNADLNRTNNLLTVNFQVGYAFPPDSIVELRQPSLDLAWNSNAGRIVISAHNIPLNAGSSLLLLDPMTGRFDPPAPLGRGPNHLSVHPAGRYVYAGLDGEAAITRVEQNVPMSDVVIPG